MYKKIILPFLLLAVTLLQAQTPDGNHIVYVKEAATGSGDGSSWNDATADLQGAINALGSKMVFVAKGVYTVKDDSYMMKNNVAIYGGFDPQNYIDDLTDNRIMPGVGGNLGSVLNGGNTRPVIWNVNNDVTASAILDGFTITNAAGNNQGSIYNAGTSPTLSNLLITCNNTSGIYNSNASPVLTNVGITNNNAVGIVQNGGTAVLINITIAGNTNAIALVSGGVTVNNSLVCGPLSGNFANFAVNASLIRTDSPAPADVFTNPVNGIYTLKFTSTAVNAGNGTLYNGLNSRSKDLAGNPRLTGMAIDIGAYEFNPVPDINGVVYVKPATSGAADGSSWDNATNDLQAAINCNNVKNVFVAIGSYPVGANSFVMRNQVAVYGGFDPNNGIERLEDNRILPSASVDGSVLDGRNSSPVIWNDDNGLTTASILDGFTITNGYHSSSAGGIYNRNVSPVYRNLVIKNNNGGFGGGVGNSNAAPSFSNTLITENRAQYGAAMFNTDRSSVTAVNVQITDNSSPRVNDGSALHNAQGECWFTNVTIAGNTPNAIYINPGNGEFHFTNSIVYGNVYIRYLDGGDELVTGYTARYSLVEDNKGIGPGNINASGITLVHIFRDYATGDYTLLAASPAIGAGNNSLFSGLTANTKDLAGQPRLMGPAIDMGAYEFQGGALPVTLGAFSAVIKGDRLLVSWTTETETDNDHFLVQLSADGKNWRTVQTIQSRTAYGNSDRALEYDSAIPLTAASLGAGLLLLSVVGGRCRYVTAIAVVMACALLYSCSKKDIFKNINSGKLFVRIVQVDKNGTERISKVIQAVRED
ncbi:choice-of-anchor Q domain-containing protein [Niabella hirudinis]|uniref:choice-of-anchor Q domain-containing protein n=1 Tax=Niabella hirudinis TaxID=1285929 RepID=UPI003EBCBBF9